VEVVEGITAKRGARRPACFCSGELKRQWRSSVGTGGAAVASVLRAVEAKESKWSRRLGRAGARGAQDAASSARKPMARGSASRRPATSVTHASDVF